MIARSSDALQVRDFLARFGTLYAAGAAVGSKASEGGRVPAYVLPLEDNYWVVRHYHRGGAMARCLGDRYVRTGRSRAFRELHVSCAARARGIATPAVVAAVGYSGGLFARYDIATQFVPRTHDLVEILFSDSVSELLLDRAATLIQQIVQKGMMHRDLNLKNILVASDRAWVIDLDRCTLRPKRRTNDALAMQRRFCRSMDKWERKLGREIVHAHRVKLEQAFHA